MGLSRASIVRGPGTIQIGAAGPVFYDQDGIDCSPDPTRFEIQTSKHGLVDTRRDDNTIGASWTPSGQLSAAVLSTLYPYLNPDIGSDVFGASDTPAYIHSTAGKKVTLHNVAMENMPDLVLSANKTLFGSAQLKCVIRDGFDPEDANAFYTEASEVWSDTSFASANVKTVPYTASWGTILTSIVPEEGWTISWDVQISYFGVDSVGTLQGILESVGVMAKCKPANLDAADVLDAMRLQGAGVARGMPERQGENLAMTSSALNVTINDAALVEGPLRWGKTDLRVGEIGFIGHRSESTGTFGALATLAIP